MFPPSSSLSSLMAVGTSTPRRFEFAHARWLLERRRGHVLRQAVEDVGEHVALGHVGPVGGHDLIRAPAEEERPGLSHRLAHRLAGDLVEIGHLPAPIVEASAPVLIRITLGLHHPVQGETSATTSFLIKHPPVVDAL